MFRDVSPLIGHNPPALHAGVAVADLGGDGRLEFVVAGYGGPNRVLRWAGGALRDCAPPDLADISRQAIGLAAGDLDGDGREELYVLNTDTHSGVKQAADRLFDAQPDGRWEDLFSHPANRGVRNPFSGRSVAAIDRRGVGRYGFFVTGHGRPMRLYEAGPGGALTDLAPPLGLSHTTSGRGVLTLPVFSDYPDVICANENGPNFAFRNTGDGTFAECAAEYGLTDHEEHGRGVTAFDPGDGEFGLCWGNWDGPHRAFVRRDGHPAWKDRASPALAFPSPVRTVVAADFDNDGHDELFFNNVGEANRLFRSAPDGFTMLDPGDALDPEGFGTGAAVCDIDGDGVLELLVSRGERGAQPLGLYKARAAEGNGWLRVRPLTRFGAPARGAVVRAEAGGRVRVKGVCGGSGYLCQMEPVAHFGFGPGGRAERVQVTWPDGSSVVLLNPGTDRTITVPYPRG
ncbi:FG-GAP repeat/ASPIC/UnbV domain protein OS=Synechococcus sp. (strain JA-3-3Ab) GN=CYA_0924 PE=4 SV=1: VCBS: VCBS: UnbV_ASPIC [Gemmataceae bacterium]|nr:FG-GAP repeat/ASPIC/UnbV domain protein OS=Synechococcus sp. (strain JA-3-3Ab) GN=CYA_0924 PE=4 SV=1: VCBS: VCBS: UnbV_ASPIC [Gemmataceae bacterium]VTT99879.1 FG-GAP repeat/ASPIC/UnbV domain protein OS=Synechococcus sp. (strain JA-3-3Ab) GN=CYA_0924 PE=4 SV=1: VCBS: VCBS: UnbV_ASPIC [Gemmataceae bacterium]